MPPDPWRQGTGVVAVRLSRDAESDLGRHAADAALDAAGAGGGLSSGAASECGATSAQRLAVLIHQHAGIAQRPVAHHLAAARDVGVTGFLRIRLVRALEQSLTVAQ